MKKKPLILTLCRRCRSDFELAGKKLTRDERYPGKDGCCFCSVRRGYTYRVVQGGDSRLRGRR